MSNNNFPEDQCPVVKAAIGIVPTLMNIPAVRTEIEQTTKSNQFAQLVQKIEEDDDIDMQQITNSMMNMLGNHLQAVFKGAETGEIELVPSANDGSANSMIQDAFNNIVGGIMTSLVPGVVINNPSAGPPKPPLSILIEDVTDKDTSTCSCGSDSCNCGDSCHCSMYHCCCTDSQTNKL